MLIPKKIFTVVNIAFFSTLIIVLTIQQYLGRKAICVQGICPADAAAGMAALQSFYNNSTGLWGVKKRWNSANALETTIDYSALTHTKIYFTSILTTFEKHQNTKFLNPWFYDDEGWWALAWIKAYDLTGEVRYLNMAKVIFEDMKEGWDSTCGGGIWWSKKRKYKDAITNELFLSVAAKLHLRTANDVGTGSYLNWAQQEWHWFKSMGLINSSNLINDGLNGACQNNGETIWTYNQGVILSGLVDLYKSTKDTSFLLQAQSIASAAIRTLAPNEILQEPCELSICGADSPQFKGVFMRNLSYLNQTVDRQPYREFIVKNANSIWLQNRNRANQFGLSWAGPFDSADAVRQSSAMDAINAALALAMNRATYQ